MSLLGWLAWGFVWAMGGPVDAEEVAPRAAGDFGLVGGPEVLWAYHYHIDDAQNLRLLRFAYRRADVSAARDRGFSKPLGLRGVSGELVCSAVRRGSLHVFYVDGTHFRYHAKGSAVERNLPDKAVPVVLVGDEVRDVLYALVPASVAQGVREPEPEPEPTTQPQPTAESGIVPQEEPSDEGADLTAPAGDYAIVSYERGAWRRDRDGPEWLTLDSVEAEGAVWLVASDGVCHLLAGSPTEGRPPDSGVVSAEVLYCRSGGEAWTQAEPVPGLRPDDLLLAAVHQGQVVLLVGSPTSGTLRLVRQAEDGFQTGPALAAAGGARAPAAGQAWALFGDWVAGGFPDAQGKLSVGYWSVADGSMVAELAPVEALISRPPSWVQVRLPFMAYGLLGILLVSVLWLRRASLVVAAALPPDQGVARHSRRLAAFVLDSAIMLPVWVLVMLPAVPPTLGDLSGPESEAAMRQMQSSPEFVVRWLIAVGLFAAYATVFEASMGATPGKRIVQCRVVDERGQRCRLGAVVLRNLIRVIEMFYMFQLMPAIILILLTRNHQRLGDLMAGTVVVERAFRADGPDGGDSDDTSGS